MTGGEEKRRRDLLFLFWWWCLAVCTAHTRNDVSRKKIGENSNKKNKPSFRSAFEKIVGEVGGSGGSYGGGRVVSRSIAKPTEESPFPSSFFDRDFEKLKPSGQMWKTSLNCLIKVRNLWPGVKTETQFGLWSSIFRPKKVLWAFVCRRRHELN